MENERNNEELYLLVEAMKDEIAGLRARLEEKEHRAGGHLPEIKAMFEEGFSKVTEAVRPLADEAGRKFGEPAREMTEEAREKINAHPFAAVMIALGAGLLIGRLLDATAHHHSGTDRQAR